VQLIRRALALLGLVALLASPAWALEIHGGGGGSSLNVQKQTISIDYVSTGSGSVSCVNVDLGAGGASKALLGVAFPNTPTVNTYYLFAVSGQFGHSYRHNTGNIFAIVCFRNATAGTIDPAPVNMDFWTIE